MKTQKVIPIIIDVTREKLSLCTKTNLEPLVFRFTQAMISDLEVVNKEELRSKLQDFIVENKVKPAPLVIVLESSVYFEKDFSGAEPPMDEVQKFIDAVPFSGVSSKVFRVGNAHKLVVINRDLYQSLQQVFEKLEFPLLSVIPGFVLGTINAPPQFSSESCRVIYRKMDEVLANSFAGGAGEDGSSSEKREAWLEKHKVVVVALSLAMVAIFVTVAVMTLGKKRPPLAKNKVMPTPMPVVMEIAATPTPEVATFSAQEVEKLSVQVLNGSGVPGEAAAFEAKMRGWGVTNIKTGNGPATAGAAVTFSAAVPEGFRRTMLEELKKAWNQVSASESSATNFDIVLVVGKITP